MVVEESTPGIVLDKCGICKEEKACDFVTRCGHWFHHDCLTTWFYRQKYCPYCNQEVTTSKNTEKVLWNVKKLNAGADTTNNAIKVMEMCMGKRQYDHKSRIVPTPVPSYDVKTVKALVSAGWNINDKSEGGMCLLRSAFEKDDLYRIKLLFDFGIEIEKDGYNYGEIILLAKNNNNLLSLKWIENYFSKIRIIKTEGSTPLHEACSKNDLSRVKSLIEAKVMVNTRNKLGVRPLHLACSSADIQVVDYLIEKGAEINCVDFCGKCPLYMAITSESKDRLKIVTKLLELKANVDFLDQEKNTLLHIALINQKFDIACLLIEHILENHVKNCFDETALQLAANLAPAELIKKLLERGADPKSKDSDGNTALHRAVTFNSLKSTQTLLESDCSNINDLNTQNESAIFLALNRVDSKEVVKLLIKFGADLNMKNGAGITAMEVYMESV